MVYKTAEIAYGSAGTFRTIETGGYRRRIVRGVFRRATTAAGAILAPVVAAFRVPFPGEILCV
jgi:hypothetical protein